MFKFLQWLFKEKLDKIEKNQDLIIQQNEEIKEQLRKLEQDLEPPAAM